MRGFIERIKLGMIHLLMRVFRLFPIDRKKVVIMSYYGKGFSDNGKAIAMKLRELDQAIDIVWVGNSDVRKTLPDDIRFVEYCSLKYYWEMATAGVWIDNCRKGREIVKRKKQYYIQTWHGMVALKRIEKDVEEHLSKGYVKDAKHDSQMADVMLSGCGFFSELCRSAFWYDGEILECGSPRLDVLFNQTEQAKAEVRKQLGIAQGKKVILYAPTFRADGNTDCYIQDYEQILAALEEKTGDEWVFAIRLHPNIANKTDFITYSERLVNATAYPDLYDIIPIADIVISDYSSLMFDSGLINKPVFLYATDIAAYKADRGFYFELEELPFPLARDSAMLIRNMTEFDSVYYMNALKQFNAGIDYYENGTAAQTVANRIKEALNR